MSLFSGKDPKILTLNSGSSSLKFKLFELVASVLRPIAWGACERVGEPTASSLKAHCHDGSEFGVTAPFPDHSTALSAVSDFLKEKFTETVTLDVVGVGHRVVHGLSISDPVVITDYVKTMIQKASDLAPLHNPANMQGIEAAEKTFTHAVQVAVFDTAFHQTMPPQAYTYPLPKDVCNRYGIRKYGFHGTSYKYLTRKTAEFLGKDEDSLNAIICHLGAGASMCAVQQGKSRDTTMGLTPLQGLMMGTRCGDIDPSIVAFLHEKGMDISDIETMLNKNSGFLGMTGEIDVRSVSKKAAESDADAILALDVFVARIRQYLGAYYFLLNGNVDALVFSAGIGEHSSLIRERICHGLHWAGIALDGNKNVSVEPCAIEASHSRIKILVIPTDEELSIAQQTLDLIL